MNTHIKLLLSRYPILAPLEASIMAAYELMVACFTGNGKLLIAGNGGSAADAEHIVGELMKSFSLPRPVSDSFVNNLIKADPDMGLELSGNLQGALPAIALNNHLALNTAFMNDCDPVLCFAQQVYGYAACGDVLLCISTSGESRNILYAATVARAKGIKIIGLTGANDSSLSAIADVCIKAPETETYRIQEYHVPIYHCLCLMLEEHFWGQ